jgi:class 3 adenylate cyclase/tetratricopeptide (TPR) repeat protein
MGGTCPSCGTENPERARFCMSCGTALQPRCPSCGAENPPAAKFCIECGTALQAEAAEQGAEAAGPAAAAAAPPPAAAGEPLPEERRQVSVLFADLSGYTAIAERMDPEAVKSLLDRTLHKLGEEVTRFGGSVDKFIGDNVMAVFGAPVAHEDDPERAVRAGLAMQQTMERLNEKHAPSSEATFLLRVGINTGEVLAGRMGEGYTVIGDTVNVAARLQAAAQPGSVTVGEATYRATRESVDYTELKPLELKGKAEPVAAWEAKGLLAERPVHRAEPRTAAPLIGRDEESELLMRLTERVSTESRPHLVTVIGQAGVGKSRLMREFSAGLGELERAPKLLTGECPPYGAGVSYWAVGEMVRAEFGIAGDEAADSAWRKLLDGVAERMNGGEDAEAAERNAALIALMLGVEPPDGAPQLESEDPQRMRDSLFSAIRSLLESMASSQPLVIAFEDIHWADEGMLDLIEHLARWGRGPLLLVCLARDELLDRRSDWGGGRRNATSIYLEPLSKDETEKLVVNLYGESNGNSELVSRVARRAGGNPLFAEEIVNRLQEGGADPETLPETVHSVLAARLDSLDAFERRLLQHASVVGQNFWEGVLLDAAGGDRLDVAGALVSLQEKELVIPSPASRLAGEREYAFKHALIRDVAYGMLPKATRCRQHFQVGSFIEERVGERGEGQVALVAEHYGRAASLGTEAGIDPEELRRISTKALQFLEAAGDAAATLYSNQEALGHYRSARDLDGQLDEAGRAAISEKMGDVALRLGRVDEAVAVWEECLDYHRRQEDLARVGDLHRKIGAGLWHKGEREASIDHYQKGIDLLKDGPPCIELVRLYEEAASLYMHTGDNMLAIYASEKALRLAERLGEAAAASRAHGIFGRVFGRIGDFEKARENLERSVELARGSDQAEAVRALLTLGYHLEVSEADYEGAGAAYSEARELAVEVGDLPSQVELHAALAGLAVYRADWEAVERETDASAALAEREGLLGKLCFPYVMRGVLRWREGDWEGAESSCLRAHEIGEQVGRSEVAFEALFWLAVTRRDNGEHTEADTALAQALDVGERAGLVAQLVEASSARAVNLALGGREKQAREAAEGAAHLAERLQHYPVGRAATMEAGGATAPDPAEGANTLAEARGAWEELDRPLDAARCELLRGRILLAGDDRDAAREVLDSAAQRFEQLGIGHLAEQARELVVS